MWLGTTNIISNTQKWIRYCIPPLIHQMRNKAVTLPPIFPLVETRFTHLHPKHPHQHPLYLSTSKCRFNMLPSPHLLWLELVQQYWLHTTIDYKCITLFSQRTSCWQSLKSTLYACFHGGYAQWLWGIIKVKKFFLRLQHFESFCKKQLI